MLDVAYGRAKHAADGGRRDKRAAHPSHATKAKTGWAAKSIQVEKADRRTSVRTNQTSKRVQAVSIKRRRQSARRMSADLHRTQPKQAHKGGRSPPWS